MKRLVALIILCLFGLVFGGALGAGLVFWLWAAWQGDVIARGFVGVAAVVCGFPALCMLFGWALDVWEEGKS